MSSVLDASAILALIRQEPGARLVAEATEDGAYLSSVNLSEVVAELQDRGLSAAEIRDTLASLNIRVVDFTESQAVAAGLLRAATRQAGLSLGDRACLALAQELGLTAMTADRQWASLGLAVEITLVR